MNKLKLFGIVLTSFSPLLATSSNAQIFSVPAPMPLDLIGIQQTGELCKNNPSLRRDKPGFCRGEHYSDYYRGFSNQNPRRSKRPSPNSTAPNPRSTSPVSNSCHRIMAKLGELDRQGVTEVTIRLRGGGTITDSPDDLIDDVPRICPNVHSLSFRSDPGSLSNPRSDNRPWWAKCDPAVEDEQTPEETRMQLLMDCHKKYAGE